MTWQIWKIQKRKEMVQLSGILAFVGTGWILLLRWVLDNNHELALRIMFGSKTEIFFYKWFLLAVALVPTLLGVCSLYLGIKSFFRSGYLAIGNKLLLVIGILYGSDRVIKFFSSLIR